MIYCVSDIHGELDRFERLLALIQFSENDHLYVIGDAIDRCAMGVDITPHIADCLYTGLATDTGCCWATMNRCALPPLARIMSLVPVSFGGKTAVRPPIGSCSTIGHLTSVT